MTFDDHANLAISAVVTAPSPVDSGTSLVVTTGEGARFPTPPFNVTIWQTAALPTPDNAEIVRVTAVASDTLTITRAQEGTAARTIVGGDLIAATVTAKTITDIEDQVGGVLPWFVVEDYGAVGDGSTDDTAAIQAAIDAAIAQGPSGARGGTVRFKEGSTYNHTGLVVGSGAEQYVAVNLQGGSDFTTKLRYVGATNGVALWMQGLIKYHVDGLFLLNGVAVGTTIGILIDDVSGSGTQSFAGTWSRVSVDGFEAGWQFGGSTSTSELTLLHCRADSCVTGFYFTTFNTLNIRLGGCTASTCDYGFFIDRAGNIQWYGGDTFGNTVTDFYFDTNSGGEYYINGFRSEPAGKFLWNFGKSWIHLDAIDIQPTQAVDDVVIDIFNGGHMVFTNCQIRGKITSSTNEVTKLIFDNTFVRGPQLVYERSSGLEGVVVVARNCQFRDVSEVETELSAELVQLGQADGTLLTIREVSETGGIAFFGATPVDDVFSTPSLRLTTSPTAGYVLTSDADGDASWQAAGAASVSFEDIAQWWVD